MLYRLLSLVLDKLFRFTKLNYAKWPNLSFKSLTRANNVSYKSFGYVIYLTVIAYIQADFTNTYIKCPDVFKSPGVNK